MVVTMNYEDAVEVFDTADRVDPAACGGNALANWTIRLEDAREGDALGGRRLWLDLRFHDLPGQDDPAGPGGLPVARRRDVASFLLADENDLGRLLSAQVDGTTVLLKLGGELVNAARLAHAAGVVETYAPRAAATCRVLEEALEAKGGCDPREAAGDAIGFSPAALSQAELIERCPR